MNLTTEWNRWKGIYAKQCEWTIMERLYQQNFVHYVMKMKNNVLSILSNFGHLNRLILIAKFTGSKREDECKV